MNSPQFVRRDFLHLGGCTRRPAPQRADPVIILLSAASAPGCGHPVTAVRCPFLISSNTFIHHLLVIGSLPPFNTFLWRRRMTLSVSGRRVHGDGLQKAWWCVWSVKI